jgi:hypothetical protein
VPEERGVVVHRPSVALGADLQDCEELLRVDLDDLDDLETAPGRVQILTQAA